MDKINVNLNLKMHSCSIEIGKKYKLKITATKN